MHSSDITKLALQCVSLGQLEKAAAYTRLVEATAQTEIALATAKQENERLQEAMVSERMRSKDGQALELRIAQFNANLAKARAKLAAGEKISYWPTF